MPRTTLEVRWSSFPIKRLSGVSPDGDAGGGVGRWQNRLRLDPPLEFLVQPLDHIGGSSDVAIPPREFPPHFQEAPVRCHATS